MALHPAAGAADRARRRGPARLAGRRRHPRCRGPPRPRPRRPRRPRRRPWAPVRITRPRHPLRGHVDAAPDRLVPDTPSPRQASTPRRARPRRRLGSVTARRGAALGPAKPAPSAARIACNQSDPWLTCGVSVPRCWRGWGGGEAAMTRAAVPPPRCDRLRVQPPAATVSCLYRVTAGPHAEQRRADPGPRLRCLPDPAGRDHAGRSPATCAPGTRERRPAPPRPPRTGHSGSAQGGLGRRRRRRPALARRLRNSDRQDVVVVAAARHA